jgi:hypothetical protein
MVHLVEQEKIQIEKVARDQKGQDLAPALGQKAVAVSHPAHENEERKRYVAFRRDFGTCL